MGGKKNNLLVVTPHPYKNQLRVGLRATPGWYHITTITISGPAFGPHPAGNSPQGAKSFREESTEHTQPEHQTQVNNLQTIFVIQLSNQSDAPRGEREGSNTGSLPVSNREPAQ